MGSICRRNDLFFFLMAFFRKQRQKLRTWWRSVNCRRSWKIETVSLKLQLLLLKRFHFYLQNLLKDPKDFDIISEKFGHLRSVFVIYGKEKCTM